MQILKKHALCGRVFFWVSINKTYGVKPNLIYQTSLVAPYGIVVV